MDRERTWYGGPSPLVATDDRICQSPYVHRRERHASEARENYYDCSSGNVNAATKEEKKGVGKIPEEFLEVGYEHLCCNRSL